MHAFKMAEKRILIRQFHETVFCCNNNFCCIGKTAFCSIDKFLLLCQIYLNLNILRIEVQFFMLTLYSHTRFLNH